MSMRRSHEVTRITGTHRPAPNQDVVYGAGILALDVSRSTAVWCGLARFILAGQVGLAVQVV